MFLKTKLKNKWRDIKTLENLIDETKRDFYWTRRWRSGRRHYKCKNNWRNKTKNKLDLDI